MSDQHNDLTGIIMHDFHGIIHVFVKGKTETTTLAFPLHVYKTTKSLLLICPGEAAKFHL
jgi:hypothetical protein